MSDDADVIRSLGRIEGRLEGIEKGLAEIKESAGVTRAEQAETLKDHDNRIKSLERGRAWLMGMSAGCGALASYAVKYFTGGTPH